MSNVGSFQRLLLTLCKESESQYAKRVRKHLQQRGLTADLFDEAPQPGNYSNAEDFWVDYQVYQLIRKAPIDFASVDRKQKARTSFFEAEARCYTTNRYFEKYLVDPRAQSPGETRMLEFIQGVKTDISKLLGGVPTYLVPEFTPGATMSDKHHKTTLFDKLSSLPTIYPESRDLLPMATSLTKWGDTMDQESGCAVPISVRHNIWFCVLKDWGTDRGCCKEASFNVAFQRAVGVLFRRRLLKWGIDLEHGAQRHQKLAKIASEDGRKATIDLKQASDTGAKNVIRATFPEGWYDLLDVLRAPATMLDSEVYLLEKFSSMGNGFTFELETILFAAICRQVAMQHGTPVTEVSVYGDDIIVPTEIAEHCLTMLGLFGFQVNESKTFLSGPFRESCGGDYFQGVRVNPVRLKKEPVSPPDWIALHNELLAACDSKPQRLKLVAPLMRLCLNELPSDVRRCTGPKHLGNVVIHSENFTWRDRVYKSDSPHVTVFEPIRHVKAVIPVVAKMAVVSADGIPRWGCATTLAAMLLGASSREVAPRGDPLGYKLKWVPIDGVADGLANSS